MPVARGIDYCAATSQNLLSTGRNVEAFQRQLQAVSRQVPHDSLSLHDYLAVANQPAFIVLVHRILFNTPALVMGGTFSATGTNTVDLGRVDTTYSGAHFSTLSCIRNLKIYSGLLCEQQRSRARRVLVMMGVAHVGGSKSY